ncbi:uncharacterized protein ASPGLDRAFT_52923 [Aspergillus glaucus CBS 516.65]|uniref:Uncharacterized protein n=1 Tax=Aspergillus glaucus CBS 516.65 TaxID=1160497 RepID=A0A1L9V5J1_ASPGL|nr:hypothetical protein ASPGLDRAFT_52923 [Aspergillus glaucus CBS 516.65]OJJ79161.1 hypothetical protein ASPGLDRAFT_52923 [Aspergillus glaucus CBS 516.65]
MCLAFGLLLNHKKKNQKPGAGNNPRPRPSQPHPNHHSTPPPYPNSATGPSR